MGGREEYMANAFGKDILIQAEDPGKAAADYVKDPFGLIDNLKSRT